MNRGVWCSITDFSFMKINAQTCENFLALTADVDYINLQQIMIRFWHGSLDDAKILSNRSCRTCLSPA